MGCLDPSGGRKLFCCIAASWKGKLSAAFYTENYLEETKVSSNEYIHTIKCFFWQNFEKITSRVQSKNKDQVIFFKSHLTSYSNHSLIHPNFSSYFGLWHSG